MSTDRVESEPGRLGDDELNAAGELARRIALAVTDAVEVRTELLDHVWGSSSQWQDDATVTEHVRRLRRRIEEEPLKPKRIVTVRGAGYRFEP